MVCSFHIFQHMLKVFQNNKPNNIPLFETFLRCLRLKSQYSSSKKSKLCFVSPLVTLTQLLEVTFLSFLEGKTLCCWGLRYSHGTRSLLRWTETRNRVQTLKSGKGFKPDFVGVKPEPKYLLLKSSLNQFLEGLFVGVSAIGMEHVPFCGGQKPGVGSKPNFLWFETGSRNSLKKINFGSF